MSQEEIEIEIPEREYGYPTTPYRWTDLVQIIEKEKSLEKLARSKEQQRVYEIFRNDLKENWKSVYDYLLHSKFGFQKQLVCMDDERSTIRNTTSTTGSTNTHTTSTTSSPWRNDQNKQRWSSYPSLSKVRQVCKVLKPNDFPYFMDDGIVHYILWKTVEDITEEDITKARRELTESLDGVDDILYWRNPPHLKSLPDIDHVHFLCRLKEPAA